jgi:nitroreductase
VQPRERIGLGLGDPMVDKARCSASSRTAPPSGRKVSTSVASPRDLPSKPDQEVAVLELAHDHAAPSTGALMDLREALYTTRAMRRITGEPIPREIQARILDAAVRAPSAGNTQTWRFLLVDDPATKARLGRIYRDCMDQFGRAHYGDRTAAAEADPDDPDGQRHLRVMRSSDWLADNFEKYLLLFAFGSDDVSSLLPALWNAQLAARGEGVGSTLTRMLAARSSDVFEVLGVPGDEGWQMAACVAFGWPTGRWALAERAPVEAVTYQDRWGEPLDFPVDGPLGP